MSDKYFETPYAAWKVANAAIVAAGLKPIPSQMLYNYTFSKLNEGKRPLIKSSRELGVERADLERWVAAYIAKKTNTTVARPTNLPEVAIVDGETVDVS